MSWRRLGFGMSKQVAEQVARETRSEGEKVKVTHGKMGYSVLFWVDLKGKHKGLKPRK